MLQSLIDVTFTLVMVGVYLLAVWGILWTPDAVRAAGRMATKVAPLVSAAGRAISSRTPAGRGFLHR